MYKFLLILLVAITGCSGQTATPKTDQTSINPAALTAVSENKVPGNAAYSLYDKTPLARWLTKELPAWSLPPANKWDPYWFKLYQKDSSLVNFLQADFNGDTKTDYSAILVDTSNNLAIFAFIATDEGFRAHELDTYGKQSGEVIDIGLEVVRPGNYNHLDGDRTPPPVEIKFPSIQLIYFEKAARTYYWKNGKFAFIQTGD